jgi:simple sugar transport system substrate-binding protein/ribose transport system substrate-binding protein
MRQSALAALIAALLLSACHPAPPQAPAPPIPKASEKPVDAASKKYRLAGVVFQEDMFFQLVLLGMRDAAKAGGAEIKTASCSNKLEKESELINTYVADKVDAIIISADNPTGSVAALKAASDQGIKIITCNTSLDADFPATFIECSPKDLGTKTGKAAHEYIEKKLGGKANIAIVQFKSQLAEQSLARVGGFKEALADMPGVTFVADQDAWLADQATTKVTDMLAQHPELNVIYAANEGGTVGATLAVKNAGKMGKVVVFGTDSSQQLLDFLQSPDDILQAMTSQQPVDIGRLSVEAALKALKGEPVDKKTTLEGILLTRTDPEGLKAFAGKYGQWVAGTIDAAGGGFGAMADKRKPDQPVESPAERPAPKGP